MSVLIGFTLATSAWILVVAIVGLFWLLAREVGASPRLRHRVIWMVGGVLIAPSLLPVSIFGAIPIPFGVVATISIFDGGLGYLLSTWQYQVPAILVTTFALWSLCRLFGRNT